MSEKANKLADSVLKEYYAERKTQEADQIIQWLAADLARVTAERDNMQRRITAEQNNYNEAVIALMRERDAGKIRLAAAQKRIERLTDALLHIRERDIDGKPCFCTDMHSNGKHEQYCVIANEALNG